MRDYEDSGWITVQWQNKDGYYEDIVHLTLAYTQNVQFHDVKHRGLSVFDTTLENALELSAKAIINEIKKQQAA